MKCSTNETQPVNWFYVDTNARTQLIFLIGAVVERYENVLTVGGNSTGTYDLRIFHVNETFAGTYTCVDRAGNGEKAVAELTVSARQTTNITKTANSVTKAVIGK